MTRILADLLELQGPAFHLGLQQLEKSAGKPNHDIHIASLVAQGSRSKVRELGLDHHDTTGRELFASLNVRLKQDEQRFLAKLHGESTAEDPMIPVTAFVKKELAGHSCLALKSSAAKKLLKANTPKKAMKLLGYRSVDSMLKHETAASLYAAAWLIESEQWTRKIVQGYGKLKATDFEVRNLQVEHPSSQRWQQLAESIVTAKKHNVVRFKELAAIVILPLPAHRPVAAALGVTVTAFMAANEIIAASTFLKLHQVKARFGATVQAVVGGEPLLSTTLLDQVVSWHMVQQYYARTTEEVRARLFEPVVHAEDLAWINIEAVLARVEPSLEFWKGSDHLAVLHDGRPVSMNLADAVVNVCNGLSYEQRQTRHFQYALRMELLLRYLSHDRLEKTILGELQPQLATEPVTI